jgi:hypothetical protein
VRRMPNSAAIVVTGQEGFDVDGGDLRGATCHCAADGTGRVRMGPVVSAVGRGSAVSPNRVELGVEGARLQTPDASVRSQSSAAL